ncbi:importin subunit alpha-4 [Anaeramoeba flamelloides]|uniref:Importin subunit alpha n=1 Tax=Anaeramoeba flamelloides TaxID=1746091 RepID=A0ABQ8XTS3_9EUKA|nr:importin subunit alpha-4 [Anaeramoeba flamelloides]
MSEFKNKLNRRQKLFKQKVTSTLSRNKRQELVVNISKNKRDEILMKRRNLSFPEGKSTKNISFGLDENPTLDNLDVFVNGIKSPDANVQEDSARMIRKIISSEEEPPITEIIKTLIVPYFVEFIQDFKNPTLQLESAWILSNLCSGNSLETRYVVELDVIPIFFDLLQSDNVDLLSQKQAVGYVTFFSWEKMTIIMQFKLKEDRLVTTDSKIGGCDCAQFRDEILTHTNSIDTIIDLIRKYENNLDLVKISSWTLSILVRGKPAPSLKKISKTLPIFSALLSHTNEQILSDVSWGLAFVAKVNQENINAIINNDCVPKLIKLLHHESREVQLPAIRTIGDMITGDEKSTQYILDCGLLKNFDLLLDHKTLKIIKFSCWALSNICAGNYEQIESVIEHNLIPALLKLMEHDLIPIKKEAFWAVSNAIYLGSDKQVMYLYEKGVIVKLLPFLKVKHNKIVASCLESYLKILEVGNQKAIDEGTEENFYALEMEENGIRKQIEDCTENPNKKIFKISNTILERFFDDDDVDFDDNFEEIDYNLTNLTQEEKEIYNF